VNRAIRERQTDREREREREREYFITPRMNYDMKQVSVP